MQRDVLQAMVATLGSVHPDTLMRKAHLAVMLMKMGNHHEAERMLREVIATMEGTLCRNHPKTLAAKKHLAEWAGTPRWETARL
mmetsp:Transcript_14107/g.49691  ORF Transcript_14107/g.49691 Transcript_14107/m.49691 type:complete len:84 (+) Transcript_14107:488-739(+)